MAVLATEPTTPATGLGVRVARLHTLLDDLHGEVDRWAGRDSRDAAGLIVEVDRARRRIDALRLKLLAAAETAQVAAEAGMSGTDAWVARETHTGRAAAARDVRLAGELGSGAFTQTAAALGQGVLSPEHAAVITQASQQLPHRVTPQQRTQIEASLIEKAQRLDPGQLRREARRALAVIEPDPVVVDEHENKLLEQEEADAYAKASLSWHDNPDGTLTGHFTLPTVAGAVLRNVIDSLTAPRRTHLGAGRSSETDWSRRRGRAFAELLEHLPTDRLHPKTAATVIVTLDHTVLHGALKAAHLDIGEAISAGEARRLACNAGILPAVLNGKSSVLDLGRQQRLFTDTQRTAAATLHRTCAATGCERPYAWCELHHQHPWSHGGRTDLQDLVPLCGHHHRLIHDTGYTTRHTATGITFAKLRR